MKEINKQKMNMTNKPFSKQFISDIKTKEKKISQMI